ncbi:hypothetical protein T439DRAFT_378965 [Meredithblackwellia eburnea MCA 4105]
MAYNRQQHHSFLLDEQHQDFYASTASSNTSTLSDSSSSPRSSENEHLPLPHETILDIFNHHHHHHQAHDSLTIQRPDSSDGFASSNEDSYDSAGESQPPTTANSLSNSRRGSAPALSSISNRRHAAQVAGHVPPPSHRAGPGSGAHTPSSNHIPHFSGDEGSYHSSRVSSRAASPQPQEQQHPYLNQWASFPTSATGTRSVSRNRSRNHSGTTTPTLGYDKEGQYTQDFYHSHHYQTSALLRKLTGTLAPDNSPVLQHKRRSPGWWKSRAERRRRSNSDSSSASPLLGGGSAPTSSSKTGRHRSCLATFTSALLRQPWVPTTPCTILFSLLLLGCFAATVTTFLFHVLSNDKQPLEWRKFCQEQRPFPHALADSLAPVNVFVGVFSVDAAFERRQLIRTTYVAHTKPIDPATGRPAQNVQVKFILGRPEPRYARRVALEMELYNDIVVLDLKENMNRGKTHAYFTWAAQNATVPINYRRRGDGARDDQIGVGFKKVDYVVKADHDSFVRLDELERNLRVTPRQKTYWGYLVRQRFMAGEAYALSADLVDYVATYEPILKYTTGAEDKRVAKWMRIHPNYSSINWITDRCWIYDHPKSGTTYAHGFLSPYEVEQIRAEGRRGIEEEERQRRGGDLSEAYSTVSKWKQPYQAPAAGLTIEEEVEALVEGGGRWAAEKWRADGGKGTESVRWDAVVFERDDDRLVDPKLAVLPREPDSGAVGVVPGVPDTSASQPPGARTTRFGKDLYRDPSDVAAVQKKVKRSDESLLEERSQESYGEEEFDGVYNAVTPVGLDIEVDDEQTPLQMALSLITGRRSTPSSTSATSSTSSSTSSSDPSSESGEQPPSSTDNAPTKVEEEQPIKNEPTGQIRLPAHNYILPPSTSDRFLPPPSLRYDPATLALRQKRMLGKEHGGTVVVHFLKRNEWFMETALHFIGREKMWDQGVPASAFASQPAHVTPSDSFEDDARKVEVSRIPTWSGAGEVELTDSYWGGARQYGSPLVRADGFVAAGRPAAPHREIFSNTPTSRLGGRLRGTPLLGFRLEDGEEAIIGDGSQADSSPGLLVQPQE